MVQYDVDVVVIGAGQGGLPAAHMAANLGARVALIESAEVGGT
jgi:glutathione reductase (NADPH)